MKIKLFIIVFFAGFALNLLNSQNRDTLGDVNGDGNINILDIIRIVNIILENDPPPTEYELWAGDVNFDESVDVTDIIILINYIIGVGVLCDYGYSFCPGSTTECCADITSHEFEWETHLLGDPYELNWLFDTVVVSDSSIYAVGYLTIDGQNYNFAHWDGEYWDYQLVHVNWELRGIKYFNENNIWVTMGVPVHWDGVQWTNYHLWDMGVFDENDCSVHKIWASDPENIIFIGYCGTIAYYDGEDFIRMESGTDDDLYSITGTDINNVWVSGNALNNASFHTVLLHYDGQTWNQNIDDILPSYPHPYMITGVIEGVYTDHPDSIWVKTEDGYYKAHSTTEGEAENLAYELDWVASTYFVHGRTRNDVFMVGAWSTVWHYNGIDFHQYMETPVSCRYYSVNRNANTVSIVGEYFTTSQAIVVLGKR